jgi:putative MATE family efflux protein
LTAEAAVGTRLRTRALTDGSLNGAIWQLGLPMTLEMTMMSVFQLFDLYWIGRISPGALAAVTVSTTLRWCVSALSMGLGVGGLAVVARRIGEGDEQAANHATWQVLIMSFAIAMLLVAVGLASMEPLLRLCGAEEDVIPLGLAFLTVTFAGLWAIVLVPIVNSLLRGAGNATQALTVLAVANGLNILIEPFLIFGWGPFPQWGVAGAALSTVLAQAVGLALQVFYLCTGRVRIRLDLRQLRFDPRLMWHIATIALPSTIQTTLRSLSRLTMIGIMGAYGTAALAAYGVANRLRMIALIPGFGLGNAGATLVGQNLGAGKPDRAERTAWLVGGYSTLFLTVAAGLSLVWAGPVVRFFNSDPYVVEFGREGLRIIGFSLIFSGMGVAMAQGLNGAGETFPPMVINLLTLWGVQIPVGYILARWAGWGTTGVWIGLGLANLSNGLVMTYWFRRGRWKQRQV